MTRGTCWACGMTFTCDPELVPAMPLDQRPVIPAYGISETTVPLCLACITWRINPERERQGRPIWYVEPGTYQGVGVYEGIYA